MLAAGGFDIKLLLQAQCVSKSMEPTVARCDASIDHFMKHRFKQTCGCQPSSIKELIEQLEIEAIACVGGQLGH